MPTGSTGFHEADESLSQATRDMHRAVVSLVEELEAIDWYQQRIDATRDEDLREILRHNLDEEMEHAALLLEWTRRRSPEFDARLRPRRSFDGPTVGHEAGLEGSGNGAGAAEPRAPVGSLRGESRRGS
jgi:uncharacterized protein